MSQRAANRQYSASNGQQYSELVAGLLVAIAESGVTFADNPGSASQALTALENQPCLDITWEDDVPFEVVITEYGMKIAAELELQGATPIYMTTLFRDE
jgi:hypothetical protein